MPLNFITIYRSHWHKRRKPEAGRPKCAKTQFHARRALELRKQFYGEKHELVAKDMVYLYWAGGIEQSEKAKYLMEAIQMMRETNPSNLNLPFMLEDYTARLMLPERAEFHEQYRNAVQPPTDENKYQIAERFLREALPIFRIHYKQDNSAIFMNECNLAYALAMQENRKDFDEHFAICKQGAEKLFQDGKLPENWKKGIELIERASAENKKPK